MRDDPGRDLGRQIGGAGGHRTHPRDQLLGFTGLDQETGRTAAQRLEDVVVLTERRQYDDAGVRHGGADFGGSRDAVDTWHSDVEHRHRGAVAPSQFHRVVPVDGLGDDIDLRIGGKNGSYPRPDHGLVVGDQHANHRTLTG